MLCGRPLRECCKSSQQPVFEGNCEIYYMAGKSERKFALERSQMHRENGEETRRAGNSYDI